MEIEQKKKEFTFWFQKHNLKYHKPWLQDILYFNEDILQSEESKQELEYQKQRPSYKILQYFYDYYGQNNHCVDWREFEGYEQFRDFYFDYSKNQHYSQMYILLEDAEVYEEGTYQGEWCDICGDVGDDEQGNHNCLQMQEIIFDLQSPQIKVLSRYNKCLEQEGDNDMHEWFFENYENQFSWDHYKKQIDEQYLVKNTCLCGKFIEKLENFKFLMQILINFFFMIKKLNFNLYAQLTNIRKDIIFEIMGFQYKDFDNITSSKTNLQAFKSISKILEVQWNIFQNKMIRRQQAKNSELYDLIENKCKDIKLYNDKKN